jgi:hypothetical protein
MEIVNRTIEEQDLLKLMIQVCGNKDANIAVSKSWYRRSSMREFLISKTRGEW